jgi:hypothetical protein
MADLAWSAVSVGVRFGVGVLLGRSVGERLGAGVRELVELGEGVEVTGFDTDVLATTTVETTAGVVTVSAAGAVITQLAPGVGEKEIQPSTMNEVQQTNTRHDACRIFMVCLGFSSDSTVLVVIQLLRARSASPPAFNSTPSLPP